MAELYYVREGVINSYALDFIVPVPANFTFIYFTWHSLIKRPVSTAGGASRSALNILSVWLFVCFEKLGGFGEALGVVSGLQEREGDL